MRRASMVLLLWAGCAQTGPFVWVDDLPKAPVDAGYIISAGDVVHVHVWNQEKMSGKALVRSDGKISLPFLKDIDVAGRTPARAAWELEAKLKDYIVNPTVYVSVEEQRPMTVSVMGEVSKPGAYPIDATSGVLQALAAAGGLNEFADKTRIYVLRRTKDLLRIRFTYDSLVRAQGNAGSFRLTPGDVVVVE